MGRCCRGRGSSASGPSCGAAIFYGSVGEPSSIASLNVIPQDIPAGACVVYDTVGYGIMENRFISNDPACPDVVDPVGLRLQSGNEVTPATPALVRQWKSYFEAAQYVVLDSPTFSTVPTKKLQSWFHRNYHVLFDGNYLQIYEHNSVFVVCHRSAYFGCGGFYD